MSKTTARTLLTVHLAQEQDFLLARQRAKQLAAILGFEIQDQTRIATAVSEIARNAYEYGKGGRVEFFLAAAGAGSVSENAQFASREVAPQLRIVVTDSGAGIPHLDKIWSGTYVSPTGMGIGLTGARRLMDGMEVETGEGRTGTRVTLVKYLPRAAGTPPTIAEISAKLAQQSPATSTPARELQDHNQELLTLLGDLRARESELEALNAELAETNRGVLVLYAELEDKAQAVQQASEMKTRFLSGITHELRTPLNSIVSLSRLMLSHSDGPLNLEQEKQAQFILRSAQNLSEMVNDLLDLARIEAGKATTNLTIFTLADLYSGLRGMFRPLATNPAVKLSFVIPPEPITLHSDEGKLAQVLRNFISNALKFTESGTITVTATPLDQERIRFSVADTGAGIAPEHHELVMQEWGQIQSKAAAKAKGSGLGLPLARSLAEVLGGTVDFTSAPGVGSTFNTTLPALLAQPATPPRPTGEHHILMVDDDEVSRYLLRRTLGSLTTAPVHEAATGEAAVAAIAQSPPCLLFLDLVMPGFDGFDVAREVRANPATRTLPTILYTSRTLSAEETRAAAELDLTVISKRENGNDDDGEQRAHIERALLEVGLSNMHQRQETHSNKSLGGVLGLQPHH